MQDVVLPTEVIPAMEVGVSTEVDASGAGEVQTKTGSKVASEAVATSQEEEAGEKQDGLCRSSRELCIELVFRNRTGSFVRGCRMKLGYSSLPNDLKIFLVDESTVITVKDAIHKGTQGHNGCVWNVSKRAIGVEVNK
ncbi:hypothetical protein LWI28_017723 [Acer negundo]|uniref:Uncharacterized protein n=1 Tax=Acer negundo TaxID=4023 RepID=A0AAD5JB05_ACENE|nr:hypothetical protein LWI28_017723 [Acer negundo]